MPYCSICGKILHGWCGQTCSRRSCQNEKRRRLKMLMVEMRRLRDAGAI
jgi:hypothetical protein